MNIINGASIDHLIYESCKSIIQDGYSHKPHIGEQKWQSLALNECYLNLYNPRNRLFQYSERHTNIFELVGRFIWEITGKSDLETIQYYSRRAGDYAVDGKIHTAYGKRIFGRGIFIDKLSQFHNISQLLQVDPLTRRAVIMILDKNDDIYTDQEYPCVISLQFYIYDKKLNLIVQVRSESAYRIMPMDIFLFTMIQEIIAVTLNIEMGMYSHFINNLHIYENEKEQINRFLQAKNSYLITSMKPLSQKDKLYKSLEELIKLEEDIRLVDSDRGLSSLSIKTYEELKQGKYKEVFNQFKLILFMYKYLQKENCNYTPLYIYNLLMEPYKTLVKNYINYRNPDVEIS